MGFQKHDVVHYLEANKGDVDATLGDLLATMALEESVPAPSSTGGSLCLSRGAPKPRRLPTILTRGIRTINGASRDTAKRYGWRPEGSG